MFRFTIRDVLWVMVAAGMGAAWHVDSGRWAKALDASQNELIKEIERNRPVHGIREDTTPLNRP